MADDITFDDSDFLEKIQELNDSADNKIDAANRDIALTILLVSHDEVPILIGDLQNSGQVDHGTEENEYIVGYNKVYAAYQHEGHFPDGTHIIKHHTNPRAKTKFLEDPIAHNLPLFLTFYSKIIEG